MNNQETNTHHSDDEADQKVDNLSSTEVPLLSEVELDEQVYVPKWVVLLCLVLVSLILR